MAYNLSQRFPVPQTYNRISDPGAYQKSSSAIIRPNKAPFLSNATRCTEPKNKLWSHAIYNTDNMSAKILNCTAFKSKSPRFPYEAFSKEDFEQFICQCDVPNTCECSTSEHKDEEIVCQGNIHRRLFKGMSPRSNQVHKIKIKENDIQPPFYDARRTESTAFYKGWKWSKWTSKRSVDFVLSGPGPADYNIEKEPRYELICAEKVRAYKRKMSKQLRYIETVQWRNMREGFPGPGTYDPKKLKGTNVNYMGPRAERFLSSKYDDQPGPSDYWVKRDFEPPEIPDKFYHANLKEPAPFGVKAKRLKHKYKDGPSPASYAIKENTCKLMQCSKAPFGTSAVRFKETVFESDKEDDDDDEGSSQRESKDTCLLPTWEFRSRTIRLKPLFKKYNEPSPADMPQSNMRISRSPQLQNTAPFFTSIERFQPWYNWIPVHGAVNTPGPGYYFTENPKCYPAVHRGPLCRSARFKLVLSQTPSPNEYNVGGGIESVLATHNEKLKGIMERQHKFRWKPTNETRKLSFSEKEHVLIRKSIALLHVK